MALLHMWVVSEKCVHMDSLAKTIMLYMADKFSPYFLSTEFLLSKFTFSRFLLGTILNCQIYWILINTDVLPVLIWVQTVFIGYQQMTNVVASKEIVKTFAYKKQTKSIKPH